MNLDNYLLLCLLSASLTLLLLFRSMYYRRAAHATHQELAAVKATLEEARSSIHQLRKVEKRLLSFQEDLSTASLTTKMQQSRLSFATRGSSGEIPEKYRYVSSLAQRGMDPSDIASILTISNTEAEQLSALAALSHR